MVSFAESVTVQLIRYVPAAAGAVKVVVAAVVSSRLSDASSPLGSDTLQAYSYEETPP
jgi:hypothetical protein